MIALAWNTAGRVAMIVGTALHRTGLALCGLAGDLDARADLAGYWTPRRSERVRAAAAAERAGLPVTGPHCYVTDAAEVHVYGSDEPAPGAICDCGAVSVGSGGWTVPRLDSLTVSWNPYPTESSP